MRLLTYSHDSCGLGHLKRTFVIGRHLAENVPSASVLSVVGSAVAGRYFDYRSANHDFIKLPSAKKLDAGRYEPRHLAISYTDLIRMRSRLLSATFESFQPDFVVVDKNPSGLDGELARTLERFRSRCPESRIVLGLRDILDSPEVTRLEWQDREFVDWVDRIYDAIWIWGEPDVYDAVESYRFPDSIRAKTHYLGYLPPDPPRREHGALRAEAGIGPGDERLLLVAAGGGGDALAALGEALAGIARARPARTRVLLVAGPLMSESDYRRLHTQAEPLGDRVKITRFVSPFEDWLRASDAVICMGGYNTLREIAAIGKPTLVLPRSRPRLEQSLRARIFAEHGWCEFAMLGPGAAAAVADFCSRLESDRLNPSLSTLSCRGLESMMELLGALQPGSPPAVKQSVSGEPAFGKAKTR